MQSNKDKGLCLRGEAEEKEGRADIIPVERWRKRVRTICIRCLEDYFR